MNIGLIRMRYTPYGGAEVFLSRLVKGFMERGHRCHLFTSRWKGAKGLDIHKVRVVRWPSFLKVLSFALNASRLVEREALDAVIGLDRTPHQDIYRAGDGCHREWLLRRKDLETPLKYTSLWLNPLHLTILAIEKRLFRDGRLKAVVVNSKRVKEEIMRHYGLPGQRIHVIYNGIEPDRFDITEKGRERKRLRERLGLDPQDMLLLFVGSGFERKGLGPLIRAVDLLRRKEKRVKLLVVGKGRGRPYRRMIEELGLERDVFMVGPKEDVRPFYYGSDIFVLPSIYEPFSNACLEAMAAGLPVVTSRTNGISEIMEGGEGEIVEEPLNPEEIADKILSLFDRERREEAGKAARAKAQTYTMDKTVRSFLSLVEEVVGRRCS